MKRFALMIIVGMLWLLSLHAQDNDFNPSNPPDPSGDYRYKLTVTATPAGYTSGTGRYQPGEMVEINTSAIDEYYHFRHWLKDGEVYEAGQTFTYTTEAKSVNFVAVYDYVFDPSNPADPQENFKYTLQLTSNDAEACSYNIAAKTRQQPGARISVCCYPNSGFPFLGWYEGETHITNNTSFYYTMPNGDARLEARFGDFNPDSPDDPNSQGGNIQNYLYGDVNGDRKVSISDIVAIVRYLNDKDEICDFISDAADVDNNGVIDIKDIQNIKTYLLKGITFETQIKIDKNLEDGRDLREPISPKE